MVPRQFRPLLRLASSPILQSVDPQLKSIISKQAITPYQLKSSTAASSNTFPTGARAFSSQSSGGSIWDSLFDLITPKPTSAIKPSTVVTPKSATGIAKPYKSLVQPFQQVDWRYPVQLAEDPSFDTDVLFRGVGHAVRNDIPLGYKWRGFSADYLLN